MPKKRRGLGRLNSAETTALSVMRTVSDADKSVAYQWFERVAEERQIRDAVLRALKRYAQAADNVDNSE